MGTQESFWYKGDGTPNDAGAQGLNLTAGVNTAYAASPLGSSFVFNGNVNSACTAAAIGSFGLGSNFAIAAWYKTSVTSPGDDVHVALGWGTLASSDAWNIAHRFSTGKMSFHQNDDYRLTTDTAPTSGVWAHFVFTRTAGSLTGYINGTAEVGSEGYNQALSGASYAMGLGRAGGTSLYPLSNLDEIDDVRIWTQQTLAGSEVTWLYNGGAGRTDSLTAYGAVAPTTSPIMQPASKFWGPV